jgi:L,D-peptidoglycan transpeptidase YkuD (ErfK/YbiS/YcfS/YnhG family)
MQKTVRPVVLRVRRSPLSPSRGVLQAGPLRFPCALGRSGTTAFKREGDGATPLGSLNLLSSFRRPGRLAGLHPALPTTRSRPDSGWCDTPSHACYNQPVRLPFPASAETLQRSDRLYDLVVVLDWNMTSRQRGRGSAIFLHIAHEDYRPTEGCVAVSPADMRRLQPFLRPGMRLIVST